MEDDKPQQDQGQVEEQKEVKSNKDEQEVKDNASQQQPQEENQSSNRQKSGDSSKRPIEKFQDAVDKVIDANEMINVIKDKVEGHKGIQIFQKETINYFKDNIDVFLDKYDNDFWKPEYDQLLWDFAQDDTQILLCIWCQDTQLAFSFHGPPKFNKSSHDTDFCYFMKIPTPDNHYKLDFQNISTCFAAGKIQNNYLKALLNQMNNIYIYSFIRDKSWPENTKKEFMGQLDKFMACLTEQAYAYEGFTELYIPNDYFPDAQAAHGDKDLIQRLESTMIFWNRQIKEVVNNQDSQHDLENAGPLDEIDYWRRRKNNLSYIDTQLEKPDLIQIQDILQSNDSTYNQGFQDLKSKIKEGSIEADDNLLFLKSLYEPCKQLQDSESPKQIPEILPSLLNRVRMIFEKSSHYNKSDRITGLLHKISNEIIKRCKKQINIKDMLDGDIEKCMQDLQDSIDCGNKWRKIYQQTSDIVMKNNKEFKWDFSQNTIFAQVDAFVQRCIELKEICEGQLQFARKGSDCQIPQFGGSKGPEIINILEEIKLTFRKSIEKIRQLEQDKILDVKASSWHDEFNSFKIGMKDLDIMYQKVIMFAFESVVTVKEGVEMLEAFDYLAKRESIKNAVKKKAVEVIQFFQQELEQTKYEYDHMKNYKNLVPLNQGKYSGQAVFVRSLVHRIDQMKEQIDRLSFVDDAIKKPALDKYDLYFSTFRQFTIQYRLKEWKDENKDMEESHNPMEGKLSKAVLVKNDENIVEAKNQLLQSKPGHLESNFDRQLFNLMKEVTTWKKLANFGVVVPAYADDITTIHKEPLRVLREFVLLAVRDYNNIIECMEEFEENKNEQLYKKLFKQHLEQTEKVIAPGLNKLKWSSKTILENFVRDVRKSCSELSNKLHIFKSNTQKIYSKCQEISQIPLILIDKKQEYEIKFFMEEQEKHRKDMQEKMKNHLEDIKQILGESYEYFLFQRQDIQRQWFKYVSSIDMKIEEALKKSLKVSLLQLQKTVGDEKTNPIPQFRLSVELENNQLGFKPTTDFLIAQVRQTTAAMTEVVKDFKRMELLMHQERVTKLTEVNIQIEKEAKNPIPGRPIKQPIKIDEVTLEDDGKKLVSFYDRISEDHDIKRYTDKILNNLKKTCDGLGELLDPWRKRDNFWLKIDIKEKMTKMMADQNESISHLKSKIENYEIIQSEIHAQKTSDKSGCISLDNTSIKNTLIEIMGVWQNVTLSAIQEKACKDLSGLYQLFQTSSVQLSVPITDLHQFKKSNDLLKKLQEDKPQLEGKLLPLEEKFKLLDEYSLALKDDEQTKRNNLRQEWNDFCNMLDKAAVVIQKSYNDLYLEQSKGLDEFMKEAGENKAQFITLAPFQSSNSNEKAFQTLAEFKEITKAQRSREEKQKFGVELFKINYVPSTDLEFVEKEIQNLEMVWQHKESWDKRWKNIMNYQFRKVNVEEIEEEIEDDYLNAMKDYPKDVQKWEVTSHIKITLEQVKSTLPLIQMLREPYMRDRHWEKMQRLLGSIIEPNSENFSIGEVFKLNLIQNAEAVREICEVAREEYKIESALQKIEVTWESMQLEMEPHKKTYKIKKIDEINSVLEENMTILATQKTTLFYESFKSFIENWENILTQIMETLEILMQVQRQWIYLESIFASQQNDQDKQLIGDITKFMAVNTRLSFHMTRMFEDRNVKRALIVQDFLTDLYDMSKKLEESQKILFQLLERKRKEFPRFYFIYNDDLFELLGNSKEPQKVNKHVKKCFEGIKKLEFSLVNQPGRGRGQENWEVVSIQSPDGEQLQLAQKVPCELGIESWLFAVEKMMRETLKKKLMSTHLGIKRKDAQGMKWVDKWIQAWPGQLLITASQIFWTNESLSAINNIYNSEKPDKARSWKIARDEKKNFIEELTKQVRKPASEVDRLKLVALITVMVHSRDIMEALYKTCTSPNSFEWLKQLRFYYTPQSESYDCYIEHINNTRFPYGFEYQGNNGRLVATGLTDRCYMTLTAAMMLKKGGAPQGPAGTGKTETVKDLGKGLAKFVIVFNCSDGLDYKYIARQFSGLMQTGCWGCFDEFNRIELEVLSVVAQQVHQIYNALKQYHPENFTSFAFEGEIIPIKEQAGIFITMNPGYAGRSELPDNLKSQFRPISMMLPELANICEIMLQSEGFKYGKYHSVKMTTLYNLMIQQLSKQDHYDFGLRAIKSVLTYAGMIKRDKSGDKEKDAAAKEAQKELSQKEIEQEEIQNEIKIIMKAIRDMNIPKFVVDDVNLFNALFQDLFPNIDMVESVNQELIDNVEVILKNNNLQINQVQIQKITQLFDATNTRHGNMLVGKTLSGKSTVWKILQKTINYLHKSNPQKYPAIKYEVLNPKSITINDLFGYTDIQTMEWYDGVLSTMMARLCREESNDLRWMILDGPVDTLWIESMNTVLDDNKVLTLLNGDRISLPPQMGLLFEVQDLSVASPATVSRAGMVYLDINDLGWDSYVQSWVEQYKDEFLRETLNDFIEKWIPKVIKAKQNCKELIEISNTAVVIGFCKLLDSLQKQDNALSFENSKKDDLYVGLLEKWFAFALIWSFGASVNEEGRNIFDYYMRDIESMFPHNNTVYDYYINTEKMEWGLWEEKIGAIYKPPAGIPFHKMFVPTADTTRNRYVIQTLTKQNVNVLCCGVTGTGKTVLLNGILIDLDDSYSTGSLVFSAQTTAAKVQDIIESKLVKRTKNKMVPSGKKAMFFIDDLNMPRKDTFGTQSAIELLRQWMDYQGWFDSQAKELFKYILDIQFVSAMGPPGGGRAQISHRLQSKFFCLNFTFPNDKQLQRIFQSILAHKFSEFDEEIKPLSEPLSIATINIYKRVSETFLPIPAKCHYMFNLRDMSKVIQGLYQINRFYCDSKQNLIRVWVHECIRVFHDRLVNFDDRGDLKKIIIEQIEMTLLTNMKECTNENEEDTIFVDFFDENAPNVYQEVSYAERGKLKQIVEDKLKEYNEKSKSQQMNIVLFQDAIYYICKIHRIIKLAKGHGLLVGEGGSGRHCLTRLASFIAGYQTFQIELHKNYKLREFREDIKRWSTVCGLRNKQGVFLFSDNEIIQDSFVEDINNILTVGEIPNLFSPKEDLPGIREKIKKEYLNEKKLPKDARIHDDELNEYFYTRIQSNFHIMICMSKTGDGLKNYIRMYPGIVNNTTCIWYLPWPTEALIEVAHQYLEIVKTQEVHEDEMSQEQIDQDRVLRSNLAKFFGIAHTQVIDLSNKMFNELKRVYYVTPTIYIDLVTTYTQLLDQKQKELGGEIHKLSTGLNKLDDAAESSEELQKMLGINQVELSKKSKDCEDLMIKIENDTINANESQKEVEKRTAVLDKEKAEIESLAKEAQQEVEKAEPILRAAEDGLNSLQKNKIAELKAYNQPPPAVNIVCQAIMTILGKDTSWPSIKKELNDPDFMKKLKNYDKENMSQATIKKMEKYTHKGDMSREAVMSISDAAGAMWDWVLAMEAYAKANKDIEPKRKKVASLKEKLKKSEDELMLLRENFFKLKDTIIKLNDDLVRFKEEMQKYHSETSMMQIKLDRSDKLITGLSSTKEGWINRKKQLELNYQFLIGDALLTAAFMSYAGPFGSEYRESFLTQMMLMVKKLHIPHQRYYNFQEFLAKPSEFLTWSFQGLPDDAFSKDNGVLVTKSKRWALMIDPQMQGNKWIKQMEKEINKSKLIILDQQTPNYIATIEKGISNGSAIILQNIEEEIETTIEPVLKKSFKKVAGKLMLIMGEKEILYDPNFRFYMTTKLSNPTYKPEVSTQVTLVNFIVKEKGLEEQLTSEVIRKMENNLEKTRIELIQKKGSNEQKLRQLDDEILRMLQETKGSLVDDETLIKTLQQSKETEEDVRSQIENSVTAMKKTMAARENYKNLARVAAKLFFIVNDFSQLDNMYQLSLDSYIQLFSTNIIRYMEKNPGLSDSLQEKLASISEKHKQEVYKFACRGLFEKDKLLLSFQMAINLSPDIDLDEYQFLLKGQAGGSTQDAKNQPGNPNPDWITTSVWAQICELEKMPNFAGIIGAFVHNSKEWKRWFMCATPETDNLPGEWEQKCDRLRKMILLKIIRPDRVLFATTAFVADKIGEYFITPISTQMDKIYEDTSKNQPIIFILVPGVDPLGQLEQLAHQKERRLIPVSLGQGQVGKAREKIYEASRNGSWLYLSNCHLSLSFLKELEKILEQLEVDKNSVHENFRLFMSAFPHPKFPISILQNSLRVTTEPPKGLKANMSRIYLNMDEQKFYDFKIQPERAKYKKLVFALSWFHSIIIERNKFKSLGWNLKYDFNDSDWLTSDQILRICLEGSTDKGQDGARNVQWDMIKYIISEVLYGGRVTDEIDRRLLNVYSNQFFNEKVIGEEKYFLADSNLPYFIPDDAGNKDKQSMEKQNQPGWYEMKIREFPQVERPEAFGQHINAEISSQIADTNNLIDSIISLQPRTVVSGGESRDSKVLKIIKDLLSMLPSTIEIEEVILKINPSDQNPLKIVLLQEIQRHNLLIDMVYGGLVNLDKGIHGIVLISEELEIIYENLFLNKVPQSWSNCYHSLKCLSSWMLDLVNRMDQLHSWAFKGQPNIFWISGFSFPTGFTTALQQQSARKLNISIDQFTWEFIFLTADQASIQTTKEGAYINGLYLEGAGWDVNKNYLIDSEPMKLHQEMPIIHMRPQINEGKVKQKKGQAMYQCPTYMYPIRTGIRERPSFMFMVNLPCKPVNTQQGAVVDTDFYVKRGTALLMSLQD